MTSAANTAMRAPSLDKLWESPPHPGEVLLEEVLKPKGITQVEAARHLRMSRTHLNELIRGKRGISADTAWRLGHRLGTGGLKEFSGLREASYRQVARTQRIR